jgi:hypothetical protein
LIQNGKTGIVKNFLTYGGSTFYGVKTPGIQITAAPMHDVLIESTAAMLYPFDAPQDDRDQYGWEFEIQFQLSFLQRYELNLAYAHLEYGNFFEDQDGQRPEAASLISLEFACNFF